MKTNKSYEYGLLVLASGDLCALVSSQRPQLIIREIFLVLSSIIEAMLLSKVQPGVVIVISSLCFALSPPFAPHIMAKTPHHHHH